MSLPDQSDPFTMSARLCDDDGIVRRGSLHDGTDYPCTGHAHYLGEHIYCTGPAHHRDDPAAGIPPNLVALLRDPSVAIERDGLVWTLIGRAAGSEG